LRFGDEYRRLHVWEGQATLGQR